MHWWFWVKVLCHEPKPQGLQANLVYPGGFDSPMVDALDQYRTPENRGLSLNIPKATLASIATDTLAGIRANRDQVIPAPPDWWCLVPVTFRDWRPTP